MNTTTIEYYLKKLPRHKVKHWAVCAADTLPTTILPSTVLVVNTMPHTDGGEHWVVFYLPDPVTCCTHQLTTPVIEYFDSYGRPPYVAEYQQFLRRQSRYRYIYNKYKLQGLHTTVCAHYCLTYLY